MVKNPRLPRLKVAETVRYLQALTEDEQVKTLVKLALEGDFYRALKAARLLGNAYVLRTFHNELTNIHYQTLLEERKIVAV